MDTRKQGAKRGRKKRREPARKTEKRLSGTQGTGDILCPFFGSHGNDAIRCRDIYPGTRSITTEFRNGEEKTFHADTYCKAHYQNCWLYRMAMELMWDDE